MIEMVNEKNEMKVKNDITNKIEKKFVYPNAEYAAFLIEKGADSLNLCWQCGTCTGSCTSGKFKAFRTRKLIRRAQLGLKNQILSNDGLWMLTTCYTCYERCSSGGCSQPDAAESCDACG